MCPLCLASKPPQLHCCTHSLGLRRPTEPEAQGDTILSSGWESPGSAQVAEGHMLSGLGGLGPRLPELLETRASLCLHCGSTAMRALCHGLRSLWPLGTCGRSGTPGAVSSAPLGAACSALCSPDPGETSVPLQPPQPEPQLPTCPLSLPAGCLQELPFRTRPSILSDSRPHQSPLGCLFFSYPPTSIPETPLSTHFLLPPAFNHFPALPWLFTKWLQ